MSEKAQRIMNEACTEQKKAIEKQDSAASNKFTRGVVLSDKSDQL